MKETLKTIPEAYYDFLAILVPGFITLELLSISPLAQDSPIGSNLLNLSLIDRTLFFILGGYVLGHGLTLLSDFLIRQPIQKLFGEPSKNLLNKGTALIKLYPKGFNSDFVVILESEIRKAFKVENVNLEAHSFFDVCEQYIKQHDYETGMLCQKRHGLEVLTRNMAIVLLVILPIYWSLGIIVRLVIILGIILFFLRWNYLRIRRAQFLYHSFHTVAKMDDLIMNHRK